MKPTATQIKEAAKRYLKIVEWSEEDRCYVGSAPPLIGQAVAGIDREQELQRQIRRSRPARSPPESRAQSDGPR
jgi:hypothetical protein